MALHTTLPIYRAAEDLLAVVTDVVANTQRDFKRLIGERIITCCVDIIDCVYLANVAQDKTPHLVKMIARLNTINSLIRHGMNTRKIHGKAYGRVVELTTSIGKQANGWKKSAGNRPLHGGQGFHG
ncbi:hypothetical protein B0G62_104103 [Paraburkholderia eburnea]|uniref:bAvd-like domain-containing protein n=1 Tax=Paraburkholderia eburnea TaxID=1189126 RepID=A0A2S4MDI4_9BURK|nr:four helix bundle protein [Paraburkholderia eburnea]POR52806.1 hypothetical protein B0G62_104103 [Paraburkholderia eburnea]PRZ23674.1 hypothetical protein BX588_104103 [Paraburkholderia eburnea]